MNLTKEQTISKLTECGLNEKQITTLLREYEVTLAPLFLRAAAERGKITLPPETTDRRHELPTPASALEAEQIILPLVTVTNGSLVANPSSLPGGLVDRWEKLAELGAKVSPVVWEHHLKLSPDQLVQSQCDDMTQKYFKESWRLATIRYRDERWVSALTKSAFFYDLAYQMINRFPIEARERLTLEMIASNGGTWRIKNLTDGNGQVMMHTIRALAWDWSEHFAEALLSNLQIEVDAPLADISGWTLESAAIYFPISLHSKFPAAAKFGHTLELKAQIYSLL